MSLKDVFDVLVFAYTADMNPTMRYEDLVSEISRHRIRRLRQENEQLKKGACMSDSVKKGLPLLEHAKPSRTRKSSRQKDEALIRQRIAEARSRMGDIERICKAPDPLQQAMLQATYWRAYIDGLEMRQVQGSDAGPVLVQPVALPVEDFRCRTGGEDDG